MLAEPKSLIPENSNAVGTYKYINMEDDQRMLAFGKDQVPLSALARHEANVVESLCPNRGQGLAWSSLCHQGQSTSFPSYLYWWVRMLNVVL